MSAWTKLRNTATGAATGGLIGGPIGAQIGGLGGSGLLGSKGGDAPASPDYEGAAKATAAGNLEMARLGTKANRINQYTPYGSSTYSHSGTDPDAGWSQTTSLDPTQQKILDSQNQASLGLGQSMSKGTEYVQGMMENPFDTSQLPDMPTTADNAGRDAMTQALLDRQQPMFDRQKSAAESNLLARGFNPGSEAFKASADDLGRQQNDARLLAMQAGGQEQSRMFGLGTQAREKALQEQAFLRNEPLNTLNALRTGAQVTGPQFQGVPQQQGVAGPDLLGAANATGQYNQGIYNAQQAGQNNMQSGLFGLGAAGIAAMSDIRLKRNIKRIGTHALGIGWYIFDYVWGERGIGVMAQELFHVKPDAVIVHPTGYLMVDYARI